MFTRTVQGAFLAAALLLAAASPTAAQSLGVGVSFLGDEGGAGVVVDYSKPFATQSGENILGWVVDFGFNHKGVGGDLVGGTAGFTSMTVQGGVRIAGNAGEKVTWHGQGLVGIRRSSVSFEAAGINQEVCELLNIDCDAGASDTGGVLTVGGALEYAWRETMGLRGQLDFPIALGDSGGSTTRFALMLVFKR